MDGPQCGACRTPLTAVLRCARCKVAVYCSRDCQKKAWNAGHKSECAPGPGLGTAAESRRAGPQAGRAVVCAPPAAPPAAAVTLRPGLTAEQRRLALALNADQQRLVAMLGHLEGAGDWQGVLALQHRALAVARDVPLWAGMMYGVVGQGFAGVGQHARALEMHEEAAAAFDELGDRAGMAVACGNLGICYNSMGKYERAREMYKRHMAICDELGDRAGWAAACANLGNSFEKTGNYVRAISLHAQHKAICEELGSAEGLATACVNLGVCYYRMGDNAQAREMHGCYMAICEELGDRAGVARACGNLGLCDYRAGDYAQAREMHEQHKAICEELGDRSGVATACGNLGICYGRTGDVEQARALHEQQKAICEELGQREGVATACGNLGNCYCSTGEYMKASALFETQFALLKDLGLAGKQASAALGKGVALRLQVRADRRALALACKDAEMGEEEQILRQEWLRDSEQEAEKWLQTAREGDAALASLHLAHLAFDASREDTALDHLKEYLTWCVVTGPRYCEGCEQRRGEDAPMLTCDGCRVARFCNPEHQKIASKAISKGGSMVLGRHKAVCAALGKWRQVVEKGQAPDACRPDLLAFLQQEHAR